MAARAQARGVRNLPGKASKVPSIDGGHPHGNGPVELIGGLLGRRRRCVHVPCCLS